MIVVVPHSTYHNIRGPALRALGRIDDIIVVMEKDILDDADYPIIYQQAREVARSLKGQGVKEVALVLTGSYLASVLVYRALLEEGFNIVFLQWDSRRRSYLVYRG